MTRKHFNAIAQALANTRPLPDSPHGYGLWLRTMESVAATLVGSNPAFDQLRFEMACKTWLPIIGGQSPPTLALLPAGSLCINGLVRAPTKTNCTCYSKNRRCPYHEPSPRASRSISEGPSY